MRTKPLVAGENPAHPDVLSLSAVLVPKSGDSFVIQPSTRYILETWSIKGSRELASCSRVLYFEWAGRPNQAFNGTETRASAGRVR